METDWLLSQAFLESHPRDGAVILERLPAEEAAAFLEKTPPELAARVFEPMAPLAATGCLARLSPQCAVAILTALPLNAAAGLLRRLDASVRERTLAYAPADLSMSLRRLLHYPERTAGALMEPEALALPGDIRIGEARARVRHAPHSLLSYLYVVDREQRLIGVLTLRELMLASPKTMLSSVMRSPVLRLPAHADFAAMAAHPGWRDFHVLPVVDESGAFVGVIRYEKLRGLEDTASNPASQAISTMLSLGELYWIGLTGMLAGVAATILPQVVQEDKDSDDGSKR
ncbi:MAG TPA: CBS domain-containing protein [Candidatus Binatia bacterium]|nr:CBS domain-containing protein [Candidatus Binatia bacterium]